MRYLLHATKKPFTDKRYTLATAQSEWFGKDKLALNTDFPNLPYYKEGDLVLTQVSVSGDCDDYQLIVSAFRAFAFYVISVDSMALPPRTTLT